MANAGSTSVSINQACGDPNLSGSINGSCITTTGVAGIVGTTTTIVGGSYLGGSGTWGTIQNNKDMTDFCELVLSALGFNVNYDDFCKMSSEERKSLLRDIKIGRLLD